MFGLCIILCLYDAAYLLRKLLYVNVRKIYKCLTTFCCVVFTSIRSPSNGDLEIDPHIPRVKKLSTDVFYLNRQRF